MARKGLHEVPNKSRRDRKIVRTCILPFGRAEKKIKIKEIQPGLNRSLGSLCLLGDLRRDT